MENYTRKKDKNVLGTDLQVASLNPKTGFYRDGFCSTGNKDLGVHVVAAVLTEEFLNFTKSKGNDLITPLPEIGFPGLKPNDCWCLCVKRWKEAYDVGLAPKVVLEATHENALNYVDLDMLKA